MCLRHWRQRRIHPDVKKAGWSRWSPDKRVESFLLIPQPECRHLWRHRVSCVVFCGCSLFLFFFLLASALPAVSEMHRPSLTSAGLHPFSFTLHTIYALWEAKWCVQRHPLGVGQQQVSQNCIFLLLFFLSTADLEITRFEIRRQLSSPCAQEQTRHLVK